MAELRKPSHRLEMQRAVDLAISVALQTNDLATGPVTFGADCSQAKRLRIVTAASLCCVVFEHQVAITFLIDHHRRSSAFALLRPLFDAFWRSLWISFVASDDEIERFRIDRLDPTFETASKRLDEIKGFPPMFKALKGKSWKTMCSFTHSSGLLTQRYFVDGVIGPAHPDDETIELLHQSGWFALVSGIVLADVTERDVEPFETALTAYANATT